METSFGDGPNYTFTIPDEKLDECIDAREREDLIDYELEAEFRRTIYPSIVCKETVITVE
tara:strand:- start:1620 stop:1799 length:180 start_codon:yes stop_codon:yes gene_type:complete